MKDKMTKISEYWNDYYKNTGNKIRIPSQFAAFVLNEYRSVKKIIDFGCGDGRDSFFFANYGKDVIGIDNSTVAIQQNTSINTNSNLYFTKLDISNNNDVDAFIEKYYNDWKDSLIYARFFIHGIDENSEDNFLKICDFFIRKNGAIALEFRTNRDENLKKETYEHYRRFIDPIIFFQKISSISFNVKYYIEGFGLSKYKNDDAHVIRILCER